MLFLESVRAYSLPCHARVAALGVLPRTTREAEVHRIAGEIALMSPDPDAAKAEGYFKCALSVARAQQAKSWELRANEPRAPLARPA